MIIYYLLFYDLINKLKGKNIYMIIGNSKSQFRDMRKIKGKLTKILKDIPIGGAFLYFGDPIDKPTVGLLFKIIKERRPDIYIYMIHIAEAKTQGIPDFVDDVYWHRDYSKVCKWGGIYKGQPCSNTKSIMSTSNRFWV